jgi:hypothetical protein
MKGFRRSGSFAASKTEQHPNTNQYGETAGVKYPAVVHLANFDDIIEF